jgi:hypothetical protein
MALQGAQAGFGAVQHGARVAGALVLGYSTYQLLSQGMDAYQTKARGVLQVGNLLDQQFGKIGTTVDQMRSRYHILAADSLEAMQVFGRATGGLAGFEPAMAFSTAYGVAPTHAAAMAGSLQRLTRAGDTDPLRTIARLRPRGIAGGVFAEEVTGMAGIGGTSQLPVTPEQLGNWGSFIAEIGGPGGRFSAPGAQAGFYGALAGGMAGGGDPVVQMMRMRALGRLGPEATIGGRTINLRSPRGMAMALEQGADPQVQEAMYQQALSMAGGNEEVAQEIFQSLTGLRSVTESTQYFEARKKLGPGGFAARMRQKPLTPEEGGPVTPGVDDRIKGQETQAGRELQRIDAQLQAALEPIGKTLVAYASNFKDAMTTVATDLEKGTGVLKALGDGVGKLNEQTTNLLLTLGTLQASSIWGQLAGLGLLGAYNAPALGGWIADKAGALVPQRR